MPVRGFPSHVCFSFTLSGVIFAAKKLICGRPCEIINYSIWRLEPNLCGRWDRVINPNVGKALLRLCVLLSLSFTCALCALAFLIEFSGVLIKPPSCQMLRARTLLFLYNIWRYTLSFACEGSFAMLRMRECEREGQKAICGSEKREKRNGRSGKERAPSLLLLRVHR